VLGVEDDIQEIGGIHVNIGQHYRERGGRERTEHDDENQYRGGSGVEIEPHIRSGFLPD
jgi:hypothetical protein